MKLYNQPTEGAKKLLAWLAEELALEWGKLSTKGHKGAKSAVPGWGKRLALKAVRLRLNVDYQKQFYQ